MSICPFVAERTARGIEPEETGQVLAKCLDAIGCGAHRECERRGQLQPFRPRQVGPATLGDPQASPRLRDADSEPVEYLAHFAYDACA